MPNYTFRDKKTNEEFDMSMPWSELEKFLNHNPNLEQTFKMTLVDSVSVGVTRPPTDFQKYVLNKVKTVPGANKNAIEKRWTIPKEV
jgi:hypothetical protein